MKKKKNNDRYFKCEEQTQYKSSTAVNRLEQVSSMRDSPDKRFEPGSFFLEIYRLIYASTIEFVNIP